MAFRIFPPVFSALPSPSNLASPVTLPATSLTLPLTCWAEPLTRSLSNLFSFVCCVFVPSNFSNGRGQRATRRLSFCANAFPVSRILSFVFSLAECSLLHRRSNLRANAGRHQRPWANEDWCKLHGRRWHRHQGQRRRQGCYQQINRGFDSAYGLEDRNVYRQRATWYGC